MRYLRGPFIQRGRGLGGIFSSILRGALPALKTFLNIGGNALKSQAGKSIINAAKHSAVKAGLNLAADAMKGKNIPASIKQNLKEAGSEVADKFKDASTNLGTVKRKRNISKRVFKQRKIATAKKKKPSPSKSYDVFDETSSEE